MLITWLLSHNNDVKYKPQLPYLMSYLYTSHTNTHGIFKFRPDWSVISVCGLSVKSFIVKSFTMGRSHTNQAMFAGQYLQNVKL